MLLIIFFHEIYALYWKAPKFSNAFLNVCVFGLGHKCRKGQEQLSRKVTYWLFSVIFKGVN
ncbi:hypothetical protein X975_01744, partial [Stegodyphus mimosarum]